MDFRVSVNKIAHKKYQSSQWKFNLLCNKLFVVTGLIVSVKLISVFVVSTFLLNHKAQIGLKTNINEKTKHL